MNPNNYRIQQNRGKYRKIVLIEKSGGGCKICGYNKNISALDFHHKRDKSFTLSLRELSNTNWNTILKEFKKCELLCANCHREIHNPSLGIKKVKKHLKEKYNPDKSYENNCIDCEILIDRDAKRCRKCHFKNREKIDWPNTKWLKKMVDSYSYLHLSRKLKVSDNAIRKRIKNH